MYGLLPFSTLFEQPASYLPWQAFHSTVTTTSLSTTTTTTTASFHLPSRVSLQKLAVNANECDFRRRADLRPCGKFGKVEGRSHPPRSKSFELIRTIEFASTSTTSNNRLDKLHGTAVDYLPANEESEKKRNFHALSFEDCRKRRNDRLIGFFLSKLLIEYANITTVIDREVNPNTEYLIFYFLLRSLRTIFPVHFAPFLSKFTVQACIRDNAKNIELTSNRQLTRCHSHAEVRKRIQLMKCRSNGR